MEWKEKAVQVLYNSLNPVPTELNEIDWKSGLSTKTDRLAQHLSAFANNRGGGILVYGVNNNGTCTSINKDEADEIIRTLGNIAHNNLVYPIQIEHDILDFEGHSLLFVYIPEQKNKPVYLRGRDIFDSYCRTAGRTEKMSQNAVKMLLAESEGTSFEQSIAKADINDEDVLRLLNYRKFYEMLNRSIPTNVSGILSNMSEYGICKYNDKRGLWAITNLGAIMFANNLKDFDSLEAKSVIVRRYAGTNNRSTILEQFFKYGYAVGFEGLIDFIMKNTSVENIDVRREDVPTYPRIAIREFVANALVHQDLSITGIAITVEIFTNRLVITNPGAPLNDINRLIDLPPNSRNEKLAQLMYLLGICERRGSGIDRAVEAIEKMFLPAVKITKNELSTKVVLYPKKDIREMSKHEKVDICYQHACLMFEDNKPINNQSIRERFKLNKNQVSVASRIISDTVEANLIKTSDADMSKKYATYIPYYG